MSGTDNKRYDANKQIREDDPEKIVERIIEYRRQARRDNTIANVLSLIALLINLFTLIGVLFAKYR